MTHKVRRKCVKGTRCSVDWTSLPTDTVLDVFSRLNYHDRANLSATCTSWRSVGSSACLWQSLDLRAQRCEWGLMHSLASRCSDLKKLWFRGSVNSDALLNIHAKNLKELRGEFCKRLTDSTLAVIVSHHKLLETIQLGPDSCENITSDAIIAIAICCPKLKKLRLSRVPEVNYKAISALAKHCPDLQEIGFIDCRNISTMSLANVVSLRFLSVAGTTNIDWDSASKSWSSLPYLEGLDVSRTDVDPVSLKRIFGSVNSLKLVCAFNCSSLEADATVYNCRGKMILGFSNDTFKVLSSMFPDTKNEHDVFSDWRNESKRKDGNLDELMIWVEWILSCALLNLAKAKLRWLNQFWLNQGADLLLNLLQSSQEDVQEWAAIGLSAFVVMRRSIDAGRVKAAMKGGGVQLLLGLARSCKEGLQLKATKAIANLSVSSDFAKSVAEGGGLTVLVSLAKSMNRFVAEEAAGGLWNMSFVDEHKGAIAEAGGIKALVDLISKWPRRGDDILKRAAGALANLATDEKCSMEVAVVGGINALVTLTRKCRHEGVQEQAARALANLTAHGDSNANKVGQEDGAIGALVLLTHSQNHVVRLEAAGALRNLSFDDENRKQIVLAGGIQALIVLAHSCRYASSTLQERAAGALWGLSLSEANSIAIGQQGGFKALIRLARSQIEHVDKTVAGALWNLAFNPVNALQIAKDGGLLVLVDLCQSQSNMVRFMAILALAYMFDGRKDKYVAVGSSTDVMSKNLGAKCLRTLVFEKIESFMLTFTDPLELASVASYSASAPLAQVTESARILEAGQLQCSGAEIERFVSMLRSQVPVLRFCAAYALLQFTAPGGQHAPYHVNLLQGLGAQRVLRTTAAAAAGPIEAKIFARCVLRNLEHQHTESST